MAFEETRFPIAISNGSAGGPAYSTRIIVAASGYEDRNANWAEARHTYDVAWGVKRKADLETLIDWWHAMQGPLTGFRYRDHLDWKSCASDATPAQDDQVLVASAAGGETTTQIIKTYSVGGQSTARTVTKPVNGTVLVELNSVLQTETTNYTINYATGVISWVSPASLTATDTVKAGYEFDVPVRFAQDSLSVMLEDYLAGSASVPIVEIRV